MNIFEKIDYSNFFPWKFNEKKQLNIPLSIIKDCNSVNRLLGKLDKYVDTCMTNFLWSKELRKELEPSKIAELNIGLLKNKNMYINSDRDTVPCSDNANRLSNDEIYSLLSQGKSAEEIMSMDDSLTPKKIGARKAWLTMRNEQSNTALDENIADKIVEILDSGKADEKIAKTTLLSKEDILMLLKEYSPAEITNTFPSNYTLFQIRAFKKHMTMGRYKEIA